VPCTLEQILPRGQWVGQKHSSTELARAASLAILLLLVAASLAANKPWGLTRHGRRKQQERRKVEQQPNNETP